MRKPSAAFVLALVACVTAAYVGLSQQSVGQVPAGATGRFQMVVTDHARVFVMDANTGKCWVKHHLLSGEETKWVALGSPVREQATEQTRGGPMILHVPEPAVKRKKAVPVSPNEFKELHELKEDAAD